MGRAGSRPPTPRRARGAPGPSPRAASREPSGRPSRAPSGGTARPSTSRTPVGPPDASRAERRRAARARRDRLVLALAAVVSVGIVGAWFPVSALLHQREQLAAASAQLSRLDAQNAALGRHERQLRTLSALGRIAQEQYDLVPPGDQAYQVLPPSGTNSSDGTLAPTGPAGTGGRGSAGASGGGGGSSGSSRSSTHAAATAGGFFTRVVQTLEFWR